MTGLDGSRIVDPILLIQREMHSKAKSKLISECRFLGGPYSKVNIPVLRL